MRPCGRAALLQLNGAPRECCRRSRRRGGGRGGVRGDRGARGGRLAALRAAGLKVRTDMAVEPADPRGAAFAPARLPKVFTAFARQSSPAAAAAPAGAAGPAAVATADRPLPAAAAISAPAPLGSKVPVAILAPRRSPGVERRNRESASRDAAAVRCLMPGSHNDEAPVSWVAELAAAHREREMPALLHGGELASFFRGGTRLRRRRGAALAHLARYFASDRPQHHKATRNGLSGVGFSSKFSPWLAQGPCPRGWPSRRCGGTRPRRGERGKLLAVVRAAVAGLLPLPCICSTAAACTGRAD